MSESLPNGYNQALRQAAAALGRALEDGRTRVQVEIQCVRRSAVSIARPILNAMPEPLTVVFGTGTADLAYSDWGAVPFRLINISERENIGRDWQAIALLDASSIDVDEVQQYAERAGDRAFLMINIWPEKPGLIGIGRGKQSVRRNFRQTIEVAYYLQSYRYQEIVLRRSYPDLWQVWQRKGDGYDLMREFAEVPTARELAAFGPKTTNPVAAVERFFRGPRYFETWS